MRAFLLCFAAVCLAGLAGTVDSAARADTPAGRARRELRASAKHLCHPGECSLPSCKVEDDSGVPSLATPPRACELCPSQGSGEPNKTRRSLSIESDHSYFDSEASIYSMLVGGSATDLLDTHIYTPKILFQPLFELVL